MPYEAENHFNSSDYDQEPIALILDDNLCILDASPRSNEFFGFDKSALLSMSFPKLLQEQVGQSPHTLNIFSSNDSNLVQRTKLYHKKLKREYILTAINILKGKERIYSVSIEPCLQSALNNLKTYMDLIINNLPGAVYWKDKDGGYLGCNKFVAKMAGYNNPAEMVGKTDYDLCWREFAESWRLLDIKVMKEDRTIVREEQAKLADGRIITELTFKTPLKNKNGEIAGIIGTSLDITERKAMEEELKISKDQAESANRAKTEFISNMSHDVRTPISGVIGASDILERQGDSQMDREYGHLIHASAERLLQLLDDILEIIAADDGNEANAKLTTFSLQTRLEFIKDLLSPNAVQKNIVLNTKISDNTPAYIVSDRVKIDRILVNLISNALKFTHSGSIDISLELLTKEDDKASILISVKDTGIGIAKENLEKIFEQFYRVSPSYQNQYKGHGIGLFIVKKFISILGGFITVESELGKGSCFKAVIPVQIGEDLDVPTSQEPVIIDTYLSKFKNDHSENTLLNKKQPEPVKLATLDPNKHAALVIEDDLVARRVVKFLLERNDYTVIDVETAESALAEIIKNSYDLIITDIGLPGMDGLQLTQMIRAWETINHRSRLPIIGLSAHGAKLSSDAQSAGMDVLLSKPLSDEKVKAITERFFSTTLTTNSTTENDEEISVLGYQLPSTEEELFQLQHYPLLDEKEGAKAAGGIEILKELLLMFIKTTVPMELPLLKKAHDESDWASIQSLAHKLKGGALYIGTTRLKYACQYTERYRLAGHTKLLEPLYQQMIEVISETAKHIENWLERKL